MQTTKIQVSVEFTLHNTLCNRHFLISILSWMSIGESHWFFKNKIQNFNTWHFLTKSAEDSISFGSNIFQRDDKLNWMKSFERNSVKLMKILIELKVNFVGFRDFCCCTWFFCRVETREITHFLGTSFPLVNIAPRGYPAYGYQYPLVCGAASNKVCVCVCVCVFVCAYVCLCCLMCRT